MTARVLAEYFVTGDGIDPDRLTAEAGIMPTRVMRRGVPMKPGHPPVRVTAWCVDVERSNQDGIEGVLADLLAALRPAWPRLVEFGRKYEVHVVVSVEPTDRIPGLLIDRPVILALAELGAWLDIGVSADVERHAELDPALPVLRTPKDRCSN